MDEQHRERARDEPGGRRTAELTAVARLAAAVAHDMNNLLGAIMGHASVLSEELPSRHVHRADVDAILAAVRRARELTETLRGISDERSPARAPVDVNELAMEGADLVRLAFSGAVRVRVATTPSPTVVHGDRQQLASAVAHLCTNAVQACQRDDGQPGRVDLEVIARSFDDDGARALDIATGDYVLLTVADDGPGIAPDVLPRVFEPYFSTKKSGSGLGLSLVWGAARGHHGTVVLGAHPSLAADRPPASIRGARATLILPRHLEVEIGNSPPPPPVHGSARTGPPPSTPPTTDRRVLVVDDDPLMVSASRRSLRRLGYSVTTAPDGEAALELVAGGLDVEAILLDVIMPGLDGGAVLRRLRHDGSETPVLLCSGYTADAVDSSLLAARDVGFLKKPFTVRELSRALTTIVGTPPPAPASATEDLTGP